MRGIAAGVSMGIVAGDAGEAAGGGAEAGALGQAERLEPLRLAVGEGVERVQLLLGAGTAAAQRVHPLAVPPARVVDGVLGRAAVQRFHVVTAGAMARLAADPDEMRLRYYLGGGDDGGVTCEAALRHLVIVHLAERIGRSAALAGRDLPAAPEMEVAHPELADLTLPGAADQGHAGLARAEGVLDRLRSRLAGPQLREQIPFVAAIQGIPDAGRR